MATKVTLVRKEDIEFIVDSLERNIQALENREVNSTIESLTRLRNNIETYLEGEKEC